MVNDKCIIAECFVDTRVANILGGNNASFNHQKNNSNVARVMIEKLTDDFAFGIVDNDKKQPEYFSQFNITISSNENIALKKHHSRKHYLVFIKPAMERFLLNDAQAIQINLLDYDLSSDLDGLKNITKKQEIHKSTEFTRFIKKLKNENAPSITILKSWIDEFRNNQFENI
ncbi:MAG: hypothetical protein RL708_676 [Bacteroidota bacterium]|jgi:hypothetical protein